MFFLQVVKTRLKIIFNKYNIATICFFVLVFGIFITFYEKDEKGIKVGFVSNSDYGDTIIENYEFYNKDIVKVQLYEDEKTLAKDVASGYVDTGYVLPEKPENSKDIFVEYTSNKSMLSEFNQVFLNTIFVQEYAGHLGSLVLKNIIDTDESEIIESINNYNREYLKDAPFMTYEYVGRNLNLKEEQEDINTYSKIYMQITSLIVLVTTMIILSMDKESKNSIFINRLGSGRNKIDFLVGSICAYFIYVLLFTTLLSIWINETNVVFILFSSIIIALFSFVTDSIIADRSLFIVFIVFYFLMSLILGNIFFDVGAIKYLFLTNYLKYIMDFEFTKYGLVVLFFMLLIIIDFVKRIKIKNNK